MRLLKWGTAMEMGVGVLSLLCLLDIRPSLTWRSRSIRKMTMSSSHWGGLTNKLNDRLKGWEYGSIVVVCLLGVYF